MARRVISEENVKALLVDYQDGFTAAALAQRYEIGVRTVYHILAEFEVPWRHNRKRKRKKVKTLKKADLKPCGTNAAYARHKRNDEYPCSPCLEAHAATQKDYKDAQRKA